METGISALADLMLPLGKKLSHALKSGIGHKGLAIPINMSTSQGF